MIWYTVPGIEYDRQIGNFGSFFVLLPPWKLTKSKFWKKRKKQHLDMSSFYKCVPKKYDHMIYVSWDMECNKKCFLSFWVIFFPFTQLKTQKIKILKIWKKKAWRYYPFTHMHHKWRLYDVWFLRYKTQWTDFFLSLDHCLLFYPLMTCKIKILKKKMKKASGDIINFHLCTLNDNHITYWSWDIEHDIQNFLFDILGHFLPFYPTKPKKSKFLKNEKKCLEISSSYTSAPKIMIIICYTIPEIWCMTEKTFIFHFWLFFVILKTCKNLKPWSVHKLYH